MSRKPTRTSVQKTNAKLNSKMTYQEFVEKAIKSLREPPYKGIHVVYSNFNNAFRQYYDEDPRPIIDTHSELVRLTGEQPTYNFDAGLLAMEIGTLLARAAGASERANG